MNVILDTHSLIWFLNGDEKLSKKAKDVIENSSNVKYVSIASIWEIAIKISINKFRFEDGFDTFLDLVIENGFEILPISFKGISKNYF